MEFDISMICVEMLYIDEIHQGQVLEGLKELWMKVLWCAVSNLEQVYNHIITGVSKSDVKDNVTCHIYLDIPEALYTG